MSSQKLLIWLSFEILGVTQGQFHRLAGNLARDSELKFQRLWSYDLMGYTNLFIIIIIIIINMACSSSSPSVQNFTLIGAAFAAAWPETWTNVSERNIWEFL